MENIQPSLSAAGGLLHREGELREQLAAYFLNMPPLACQTEEQHRTTCRALSLCWDLDMAALLRYRDFPRPQVYGDLHKWLRVNLDACRQLLPASFHLSYSLVPMAFYTRFEPRSIQMSLLSLLRDACLSGSHSAYIAAKAGVQHHRLTFACMKARSKSDAYTLASQTAGHHGGVFLYHLDPASSNRDPAVCQGISCGWKLPRQLRQGATEFGCPSVPQLLQSPLSPVFTGIYSCLDE